MADRLAGPLAKVERAKEHIRDVDAAVRAFLDGHPYVIHTKRDPETRQLIYFMASVGEIGPDVALRVGDALQNLRSALDHLAYQLWLVGTGRDGPAFHVYFPIFDSATEYKAKSARQVQGMAKAAIKAIDAAKPYKGGNDTLWLIHHLNRIDKHRLLVTVGSAFNSVDLGGFTVRHAAKSMPAFAGIKLSAFFKPNDRLYPLKKGDELFRDAPDAEVDEKLEFAFDVALGEPKVSEGEPVIESLQQMVDFVDHLLTSFRPLL